MICRGFQINLEDLDDTEEGNAKIGLASNEYIYGASIISLAKREICFCIDESTYDFEEDEE